MFLKFKMISENCYEIYYIHIYQGNQGKKNILRTEKALRTLKQPLVTVFENASIIIANLQANGNFLSLIQSNHNSITYLGLIAK